ncbi:MAG: hypothetical protein IJK24_07855 [Oscillospiraceae bacterium]|nr:hypothetical protein [Oscillospiraceae bacterium]
MSKIIYKPCLTFTNDFEEIRRQGKALAEQQTGTYNERKLRLLKEQIGSFMNTNDSETIERELYQTIWYYWMYGASIGDYFIYHLWEKPHEEIKTYALLHDRVEFRNHLNRRADTYLFENKYETFKKFEPYYLRDVEILRSENDFDKFCDFVEQHPSIIIKPLDQSNGRGIHFMEIGPEERRDLKKVFLEILEEGISNQTRFLQGKDSAIIIEEVIRQDDRMSVLHPNSVNGVRVTTVRENGHVHVYGPWLKVGVNNEVIMSEGRGAIVAGINAETGIVDTVGMTEKGLIFEKHPQSGVQFNGFVVPEWDFLCKLATAVAQELPETLNYVGWDFVLSQNGWCVMEGNDNGDFLWQMVYQRGMKREFENLIGWSSTKDYWWEEA